MSDARVPSQAFAGFISGVDPGTTYRFRAVTVNAGGTNHGAGQIFTTLPLPRVLSATPQTGGAWLLRFHGIHDQPYTVEVSTNLITWNVRTNLTAGPNGDFAFIDDTTMGVPARFYRLKVP